MSQCAVSANKPISTAVIISGIQIDFLITLIAPSPRLHPSRSSISLFFCFNSSALPLRSWMLIRPVATAKLIDVLT